MSKDTLIFQHIPKTAGSTLHSILNKRYRASEIYNVFASAYSDPEAERLRQLPDSRKHQIKLLKGHMPFGLHRFLPQSAKYFTVLRDPVKRVISQYFYIRVNKQNPLHEKVVANNWTLGELLQSGISVGMNDGQTRWILGELHALPFNGVTQVHMEQAKEHLKKHYIVVGVNEKFDQTLLVLAEKLSWRKQTFYRRKNTNKGKSEVTQKDLELIVEYNKNDIALYEFALRNLQEQIQEITDFEEKLAKFQRANKLYQWACKPLSMLGA